MSCDINREKFRFWDWQGQCGIGVQIQPKTVGPVTPTPILAIIRCHILVDPGYEWAEPFAHKSRPANDFRRKLAKCAIPDT